jgi:DNA-binding MarR family transcriptional regulator
MDDQQTTLYMETVHMFLSVYRHLRQHGRQMHDAGIGGRKIATLRYLREFGPLTVGQIRDYLYVSDSSTSELIARLEEKGYVQRSRSRSDNRVVIVTLTPAGQDIIEQTPLDGVPLLRERLKGLPVERLSIIKEAMAEIMQILEIQDAR